MGIMYVSVKMSEIVILVLCLTVLMFGDGLRIKECSSSYWLEIRENNIPADPITCVEFFASNSIFWILSASGAAANQYTCGPGSQQCTSTDANVTISRTNQGTEASSVLTIVRNHRTVAGNGAVACRVSGQTAIAACLTNVISPARVTSCGVTNNAEDRTVSGSCQYQNAYSSNGTYTCTWYRQGTGQSSREYLTTVDLSKTMTSDGDYYRGVCSLPSSPVTAAEGTYNYTVDFIPGPDRVLAGSITIGTSPTLVTLTSTADTPSTSVTSSSTADSSSTSVTTSSTAGCDRGVPLGAVIGGFVVALIVIVVLIVIILVLVRRKRHQVPETSAEESVHADAPSETNAAYSSLFEDYLRTGGRNLEPRNRGIIALNNLSVHSPAPPLQRRDEAETANPYDLIVSVYEISPPPIPSSSASNVQPSDGRPSAEENDNAYIAMNTGQSSMRERNMPLTSSRFDVYANDLSAQMANSSSRGQEASPVLSRAESFSMDQSETQLELNAGQRENQQREQQTSADYENARPSQQGITHPEEGTRSASNEDYYNTRGICPKASTVDSGRP